MSDIHTITLHDGRVLVLFEKLEGNETEEELSIYLDTVYAPIKENMFHDISLFGRYGLLTIELSELTEEQVIDNDLVECACHLEDEECLIMDGYADYMGTETSFYNAKDSLISLLKSHNIDTSKEWVLILKK